MTYNSKGRSTIEVAVAVGFVCFLIGFVSVLCLGNYYRAMKAMERQKQRRLARLSGNAGNGVVGLDRSSPQSSNQSTASTQFNDEDQPFLVLGNWNNSNNHHSGQATATRRRPNDDELLFHINDTGPRAIVTSI